MPIKETAVKAHLHALVDAGLYDRAAHVAHEGGQSALFGTGAHERVGWIGRE